ncbi:lipopolysaccharide-induced tumor necrosis factor-alpha factor homolog isoform X3 [Paralichthys olivaceus]|uniref:lipopolysaccharide-induced tumor necrosis factor-alpha factor homolog isoform X3 n=1 Tax=Paralichthys olivaceus TaxID=8255 RepID=UPI003753613B
MASIFVVCGFNTRMNLAVPSRGTEQVTGSHTPSGPPYQVCLTGIMNVNNGPTYTVTNVPATSLAVYDIAASSAPPQPIVYPVHQPGYQYAQQQPQNVQPDHQYAYALQQPQNVQPDHQYAYALQQPQNVQPVMFMVQQLPKEAPGQMVCPGCRHTVLSIIKYKRGVLSWTLCGVLFAFLCWPCFWIPLVADACKDVEHSCPICKTILHVYKRR